MGSDRLLFLRLSATAAWRRIPVRRHQIGGCQREQATAGRFSNPPELSTSFRRAGSPLLMSESMSGFGGNFGPWVWSGKHLWSDVACLGEDASRIAAQIGSAIVMFPGQGSRGGYPS